MNELLRCIQIGYDDAIQERPEWRDIPIVCHIPFHREALADLFGLPDYITMIDPPQMWKFRVDPHD